MVLLQNEVLLLKTPGEHAIDKYEAELQANKLKVKLIRTLKFNFKNIDLLADKLSNEIEYSGIIFSSPRCVEAVNLARKNNNIDILKWASKLNYAVGEASCLVALKKLGLKCSGQDAGSAIALVKRILRDKSSITKPFLYPHGNLKSDTLSRSLNMENITLDCALVYDTIENPNIQEEIRQATNDFLDIAEFVVFFSPSGLHSSLKYLKNMLDFPKVKIIAIGPTTETAIKEENLPVYAAAKQPSPQGIVDAIFGN